jgi:hypothetical protein
MSLAETLLAGSATCALCVAPALSREAPNVHLASAESPLRMKVGGALHHKTVGANPDIQSLTETVTFTGSLSFAAYHDVPVMLWAEGWFNQSTCMQPAKERLVLPKRTAAAKLSVGTTTGTISGCGSKIFTYYGPIYDLKRQAASDAFTGVITAKKFDGYHLTLIVNTDLTITQ